MSESFLNSNVTRFENIELADGSPGDIPGQGMKRDTDYYVTGSRFALGVQTNGNLNEEYYVAYNNWPVFANSGIANHSNSTAGAIGDLKTHIGIDNLVVRCGNAHTSGTLDCVIVRKSDRKAVHLKITGSNKSHYEGPNKSNGSTTITALTEYWTPAKARLFTLGII
tara:strand:+ start:56 stop:556 length:501 start_codon:yes stop_codon:yes gene_type:complete